MNTFIHSDCTPGVKTITVGLLPKTSATFLTLLCGLRSRINIQILCCKQIPLPVQTCWSVINWKHWHTHTRIYTCMAWKACQGPTILSSEHQCLGPARSPADRAERDAALCPAAMFHCANSAAKAQTTRMRERLHYWSCLEIRRRIFLYHYYYYY